MAKRPVVQRGGGSVWLALFAVLVLVWGLERWRRSASTRAGTGERSRFVALTRCILGRDGLQLLRSPDAMRGRMRRLAMTTATRASVTWLDQCVPLAQSLARHAVEVERTQAVTAPETRLREHARALAQAVARVGLVWRIRTGDPDTDMDPIADALALVGAELDLAGAARAVASTPNAPVAPAVDELPSPTHVTTTGLEPTHLGGPARFLAGAPLPLIAEVSHDPSGWHVSTLSNEPSVVHRVSTLGVVRLDALTTQSDDGLAPIRLVQLGLEPIEHRISPVNQPTEGARVSVDATPVRQSLWLAQWTPWSGTSVLEFQPRRAASTFSLAPAPPRAPTRSSAATGPAPSVQAPTRPEPDEHVAIATLASGIVVAYTTRSADGGPSVVLSLIATGGGTRTPARLAEQPIVGGSPAVEFCRTEDRLLLVIAGSREWMVLQVSEEGAGVLLDATAPATRSFDERVTVRCGPRDVLAYATERVRRSPVVTCTRRDGITRCTHGTAPETPMLDTMPLYTTRTPAGRPAPHPEWPMSFAVWGDTLIAAQAVGPIVSVRQRPISGTRWSEDRVLFDAASRTHGQVVEGLGLFIDDGHATLAMATPDGLYLLCSEDQGTRWH